MTRIRLIRAAGLLLIGVVVAAALGSKSPVSSPSTASLLSTVSAPLKAASLIDRDRDGPLGEADGAVPDGTSVFDDDVPGIANLDADLLGALRRAAGDAAGSGIRVVVDSGWRSAAYQEQLLRDAVSKYGSEREAARWVATPTTSAHVSGDAVDLGPAAATAWLAEHGAAYGLCRVYGNEPWHFELRPQAVAQGCPPVYADPTHDPRMRG